MAPCFPEGIEPNRELLLNESHNNKYVFVLDRFPTSRFISKFANRFADYCIDNGQSPDDRRIQMLREGHQDVQNFNLFLKSVNLPSLDLGYTPVQTQFVTVPHVQGKLDYGPLVTTIKMDECWFLYELFYYWYLAGHNPVEYMKFKENT